MKKIAIAIMLICAMGAQAQVDFDTYFEDQAMVLEYYRVGCKKGDTIKIGDRGLRKMHTQWAGSKRNLTDPFDNGTCCLEVREAATGKLLYSRGYNTLFSEYCDTPEGAWKVAEYEEAVMMPQPKVKVEVVLRKRDERLVLRDQKCLTYDPAKEQGGKKEQAPTAQPVKAHYMGDVHEKMDIVIVGQGYKGDENRFRSDLEMMKDNLFGVEPFASHREDINVWGVMGEAGAEYGTLGADRYCMTTHLFDLYKALEGVPFDHIIIMVNSSKYGGGAIYNFYAVSSVHPMCGKIMPHELGHSIGGLADEYVDADLSYAEIYPRGIEPLAPNITTLVDFGSKWEAMLPAGTPIPTKPVKGLGPKECGPLGVYEGAGYQAKGIYRPVTNCMMNYYADFCPVCSKRLEEVIRFFSR